MKKPFLSACIIYLFVAAIIFPYVRWYADNPDTFQYLAIASKYLSGDWSHAVNGYWSPMISWLLSIPMLFLKEKLLAFKILQVLIGIFVLWQWSRFINRTSIKNGRKNILVFVSIPFLLDYSLLNATPDLLFMGFLLMLLNLFLAGDITLKRNVSIQTGLAGGLLYLTKAFGFPFFIVITAIIIFFEIKGKEKGQIIWKNITLLYGIFFLISFTWIITLSVHYNKFTISEVVHFNLSREAAPLPGRSESLPILDKGLFIPLAHSNSAWESPGEYVGKEQITPFNFFSDYLKIIKRNVWSIYYFDFRHQTGFFFILLLLLLIITKGANELVKEKWILILLLFILLLYGGYALILVHSRYTWVNNLLMMILSVYFLQIIFHKKLLKRISAIFFIFILLLSVKRPVKEILFSTDSNFPILWIFNSLKHPLDTMRIFYRQENKLQRVIKEVQAKNVMNGNIASLKVKGMDRDPYTNALRIVQEVNGRYYGQVDDEISFRQQEEELRKMDINYLITWKNTEWGTDVPSYYNEEAGVRIYSLK